MPVIRPAVSNVKPAKAAGWKGRAFTILAMFVGASFSENVTSQEAISSYVIVGLVLVATWVISRWGHRAVDRVVERRGTDSERRQRINTLWIVIRRVSLIALWILGLLMVLSVWDISITPLLAVGTVVGLALGFGAQSLVKDLIAGFFILVENQFAIGDVVAIAGTSGTVEDIQLRVTVLRDLDGKAHYVPNGSIEVATNYTQDFANAVMDIGVSYDTDVDFAMATILAEAEAMRADEEWQGSILDAPQLLGVNELADSAVVIRVVLRVGPEQRWAVRREFLRRLKNRLDAVGIEIPFPYRTLVIKGGGEPPIS